ncbi:MAG: hypothetical protein LLG13_13365 [Bacteroidales bacterium]|nr:hypothetical protein [Bacteroidales bacterium]
MRIFKIKGFFLSTIIPNTKLVFLKVTWLLVCTILCTNTVISQSKDYLMYSIGNSHTADFEPFSGFRRIAIAEGDSINNGWHINCGSPLYSTWLNPERTCVEPNYFGRFLHALSSQPWDIITIQPFVGPKGYQEKTAARDFIDYALSYRNTDSVSFFLYCTWPMNTSDTLTEFDYAQAWLEPYTNENDSVVNSREFYNYLVDSVRIKFPTAKIGYIPVGEVFYLFNESAQKGLIPGFTSASELYRDRWHLNNVGRYIASLTVYCIAIKKDPLIIKDFSGFAPSSSWPSDRNISSEQKVIFRSIISQVISSLH